MIPGNKKISHRNISVPVEPGTMFSGSALIVLHTVQAIGISAPVGFHRLADH